MTGTTIKPAVGVKAHLAMVTPAMAEKWLKRNTRNRSIVGSRIEQYAADMQRGEWRMNGEAIKIAADGTILDGQHRLYAILEAGVPVQTLVITGLEAAAQETMDQGRGRNLGDVFKLRGEAYYRPLAAAVRSLAIFERYGSIIQPPYEPAPSIPQCSRTLERNPDLRESVAWTFNQVRRYWLPSTHTATLHYLFATVDREAADDFLGKLASGDGLERHDPRYVLREKLMRAAAERDRIPNRVVLALLIKAWNAYVAGTPTTRLEWTAGGPRAEAFPSIDGLAGAPAA